MGDPSYDEGPLVVMGFFFYHFERGGWKFSLPRVFVATFCRFWVNVSLRVFIRHSLSMFSAIN